MLTTLRGAEILARGGSSRSRAAGLLDAQSATLEDFTLKTILGGISLIRGDHLDKSETTGLSGMRILHDLALLHVAVLLKETRDFLLAQARVDTGHKQVGSRVDGTLVVLGRVIILGRSADVELE